MNAFKKELKSLRLKPTKKNAIIDFLSQYAEVATAAAKPKNIKRGSLQMV